MTLQGLFDKLIISEGSPLTCKDWCSHLSHLLPAAFDVSPSLIRYNRIRLSPHFDTVLPRKTDYSCCGLRSRLGFPGEGILILCQSFNYGKGEPSFHLFGFIMCVGAHFARALKSVASGDFLVLQRVIYI
ncbi:uncharacterized protein LOC132051641 isoform X1 [Lycium ferocissimum]|uniref:uncharacterized protein LOC132051641 isoform X1 n=1 Tax=Lycium ferocissimum TaxID=112874 RepID=UPI00281519A1|nr:uncharacterized protein LOC132051641 isoform X1 [Lycium ferocissimum]